MVSWFDIVVDEQAPLGRYWVEFGIYDRRDMSRVPFFTAQGQPAGLSLRLGPVKVIPKGGPPSALPQLSHSATLGEKIQLLGYTLANAALLPNRPLEVELFWQALDDPQEEYTVFVHLVGTQGELIAQHDGPPRRGSYPTSLWTKGEVVPDKHALNLPQTPLSGSYRLHVGMYRSATMERLPAYEGGQRLPQDNIVLAVLPSFGR